jgi:hypothetical protein
MSRYTTSATTFKWTPQEVYYYAVENCGFKARPFRTQGTYSKYNSIDDKVDDLHDYTTWIKFGIGPRLPTTRHRKSATDTSPAKKLSRIVNRFDGGFPRSLLP